MFKSKDDFEVGMHVVHSCVFSNEKLGAGVVHQRTQYTQQYEVPISFNNKDIFNDKDIYFFKIDGLCSKDCCRNLNHLVLVQHTNIYDELEYILTETKTEHT